MRSCKKKLQCRTIVDNRFRMFLRLLEACASLWIYSREGARRYCFNCPSWRHCEIFFWRKGKVPPGTSYSFAISFQVNAVWPSQ
jgi:hypothetical protein